MPSLTLVIIAAFLLTAGDQLGSAAEPSVDTAEQAYERLVNIGFFAFGGTGFAGTTSPGEKAFQTILASKNARELFNAALNKGNPQARIYALVGIRKLDSESFIMEAKATLKENPRIKTMFGCIVREEAAEDVIKRISDGAYDLYLGSQRRSVNFK